MDHVWTWDGTYFGYRRAELLFTYNGVYVGRSSGDEIFGRDGRYLGEEHTWSNSAERPGDPCSTSQPFRAAPSAV